MTRSMMTTWGLSLEIDGRLRTYTMPPMRVGVGQHISVKFSDRTFKRVTVMVSAPPRGRKTSIHTEENEKFGRRQR